MGDKQTEKKQKSTERGVFTLREVLDLSQSGAINSVLNIKTSVANIVFLTRLNKAIPEEAKLYSEMRNKFIEDHRTNTDKPDEPPRIAPNTKEQIEFIDFSVELLNSATELKKPKEPIFESKELENMNITLTANEMLALRNANILHAPELDELFADDEKSSNETDESNEVDDTDNDDDTSENVNNE